ncbi:glycosyltransferase family 9 protein [Thermodesulfovibrio sp.]|jgi:ADP-heptose:LPS heptosyltransferase|uniref:glycosyltransferase family 9 protein n=1 Tax=Thermodesulfovibrio sp. TaxID=2067987 RepID=UPI003C7B8E24
MKINIRENLLYLLLKILKKFDKRQTDLKYFNPEEVKNILVVSSTAIGDTLMSTPAIRAVRERYPHAKIIAHFNIKNMELFENNPHIDGIIPYYGGWKKFFKTVREFRKHKFDVALIFHGNEPQATPMAYLGGARFILKVPISKKFGFLLSNKTNGFDNPWEHHGIDVRLKAASFIGCDTNNKEMVLLVDKEDREKIEKFLKKIKIENKRKIVCFQVGAATKFKIWPKENFIELGKKLIEYNKSIVILILGSKQEKKLCETIAKNIGENAISLSGKLSLKELRALIERTDLLVTNDTGTMHIAVALKIKTVSLFCPTHAWGVGPIQDLHLHKIIEKPRPCNPCITKKCKNPYCMNLIKVEEVLVSAKDGL